MAGPPDRVAAVVRHRGHVLAARDEAGDPALPTRPVDDGGSPEAALDALLADLGLSAATVERWGEAVETADGPAVPALVTAEDRDVASTGADRGPTWVEPADLRDADGGWWPAYAAVAPTVASVRDDVERGAAAIAVDALWALRDAAVEADAAGEGLEPVAATARRLVEARPAMAALATRVDRAMAGAATPRGVAAAATAGLERAAAADADAAAVAAGTVDGGRVLTLSRSGTVRAALLDARPAVVVCASRPGGEGEAVADDLAEAGLDVERCADGAVYDRLRAGDVDAVLVGADAVTPAGGVVNKVGTWALALAARWAGVPTYAACASDKVRAAGGPDERLPFEPLFDLTPPAFVDAVLTERGRLDAEEVRAVAAEHRSWAGWREG